ncbi:MAG TPA: SUMF1/EgtB/PvdO family nonheme iron enzyme [Opitutales bacterium]|nr:SUMF1/EgtB/PvdO family nonheme iron enzyme [Opitutales bacterium]
MGSARKARRKRKLKKLRRYLLSIAGVAFIVWVFYFAATWGPKRVEPRSQRQVTAADTSVLEESRQLAREFEAIAAQRDPNEAELDLLREAIEKQKAYNQSMPSSPEDRRRQDELERRLVHFQAKRIHERSLSAERDAQLLFADGEAMEAVAKLQESFDLQREINQRFGRSSFRDAARETRLEQQLVSMAAEPLHARSIELEQAADQAAEEARWADARKLLSEARELQKEINETARRSQYRDANRYQELANKIAALEIGERVSEILLLQEEGQQLEAAGESEEAAQKYERAMIMQNQINREHPQSRFVSMDRVVELDIARQTALSARQAETLNRTLAAMRQAIRSGDFSTAAERIAEVGPLTAQIAERFPRSTYASYEIQAEVNYLSRELNALPDLQRLLRAELLPLPGQEEWQMTSSLVSQKVFSRIMNTNPSRNRGEDLPVDSVTREQAEQFCTRASWILARPVQLPAQIHFEAALGEWNPQTYAPLSWHKENSGGMSHPVKAGTPNAHGFFHLVGNLRSWICEDDKGTLLTAGASFADEFPEQNLFQTIDHDQREPTIGFRYVVGSERL